MESNPLHGIGGGVGGNQVILYQGKAVSRNHIHRWKVVLKTLAAQPIDQPTGPHYWLREVEVYRSDFEFPLCNLSAPPVLWHPAIDDKACWLWLQFIEETAPARWDNDHFITAARHLGEFNGAFSTSRPTPPHGLDEP